MITAAMRNNVYPDSNAIEITFPTDDAVMMEKLGEIGINDRNIKDCFVVKISGRLPSLCVLEDSCINADELNYLARRIDSFDNYELAKFQGAIAREVISTMKDLINLTFNLHNYTVVTDFTDLKSIGTKHYLDKNIGSPVSEMERIDFEAIGRTLLNSGDGQITSYGVVFRNNLPIEEVYDGKMFPDYDYTSDYVFKLEVTKKDSHSSNPEKVWLYLPTSKASIVKALHRLGGDTYDDLIFQCVESMNLSENFVDRLSLSDNIGEIKGTSDKCEIGSFDYPIGDLLKRFLIDGDIYSLNKLAQKIKDLLQNDGVITKFLAAMEVEAPVNLSDVLDIAENLDKYELIPSSVITATDYANYVLFESGRYDIYIDDEINNYVDYEKYGQYKMKEDGVKQTAFGMIRRDKEIELQTIKFYSPLFVKAYPSHEYGECDAHDMIEEISSTEAVHYMEDILQAIEKEKLPDEGKRGLMVYFDRDKALAEKIYSAHPTVEEYNSGLWGVMVVEVYGELTKAEMAVLTDYISGQYSDGWGEGFEQRDIKTSDGEIYVSFWDSNGYFIKLEQEFKKDMEHDLNMGVPRLGGM